MPDDAGHRAAFPLKAGEPADQDRRGPLRPARLQSARSRVSGAMLARLFQLGDVGGLLAASAIASRLGDAPHGDALLLAAPILAILALLSAGAYRLSSRESLSDRLGRAAVATAAAAGGASAILSLLQPQGIDSGVGALWTLWGAGILMGLQLAWGALVDRLRRQGLLVHNLVVVGATPAARRLIRRALRRREVHVLGVFDDRKDRVGPTIEGVPVLGTTTQLIDSRLLPYVDRIVVAVPRQARARVAQLLERLEPIPNPISLLLDSDDEEAEDAAVSRLADVALMQIAGPSERAARLVSKRVLDVSLGGLLLLAFLPLMGLVALAIKLDSRGPVFFRQRRHGYLNEEIVVWKFRSMRVETTDATASRQVSADDDRITRVGRFIRKTSLDELPQLFNVLSGEMSLVGPRPHAIGMLAGGAEASRLIQTYAHRHRIKPGLTGWAAVNGSRGPADTAEAIQRRIALDLEYVERQSLWLDLAILLKTAPCLLGDRATVR